MHHDVIGGHIAIGYFVAHAIGLIIHLHYGIHPCVKALWIWPKTDVVTGLHHLATTEYLRGAVRSNIVNFSAVLLG